MTDKIKKIWLNSYEIGDGKFQHEIRFDWDNDRHNAVKIFEPLGKRQVASALESAASLIRRDTVLNDADKAFCITCGKDHSFGECER